jgi:hypothetical protein
MILLRFFENDILDLKKNFLADITDPKKLTSLSEQFPDEILLKERIQAKSSEMSSTKTFSNTA